ncbi:hypothetical protein SADUNF_Sadunf02G0040400 [Salix dunnii]|uniref:Uncharacterized protein n=1 Tax=Salix dunnii TaxID=1413687 RepID=A0A835N681_9ROSI|nr:hypothetical protein SADUNF_Sadunf02G0040400 [Salix dunnii]
MKNAVNEHLVSGITRTDQLVFNGCIKNWKAFVKWNPDNGGLYYLQVPIMNTEDRERVQLEGLREDIQTSTSFRGSLPAFLGTKELASVNFIKHSQCSDHNELCIVAGSKQGSVVFFPSFLVLYILGNANSHCRLFAKNYNALFYFCMLMLSHYSHSSMSMFLCCCCFMPPFCKSIFVPNVCVQGGLKPQLAALVPFKTLTSHYIQEQNAPWTKLKKLFFMQVMQLFIPEGRFHQVHSYDLKIAVYFWRQSNVMSNMLEQMDAYHLRRILRSLSIQCIDSGLMDKEMNQALPKASPGSEKLKRHTCELLRNGGGGQNSQLVSTVFLETDLDNLAPDHGFCDSNMSCKKQGLQGQDQQQKIHVQPRSLQDLHELVSLVNDRINITDQSQYMQSTPTNDSKVSIKDECEDNPVAKILWTLDPRTHQSVLSVVEIPMAYPSSQYNFPRTLEALILHLLSPVGAEKVIGIFQNQGKKFHQGFYGAFDDQFAAMDAILNGKELFARWGFKIKFSR